MNFLKKLVSFLEKTKGIVAVLKAFLAGFSAFNEVLEKELGESQQIGKE